MIFVASTLARSIGGQPIGIFGGTFDPIHHGHLRVALDILEELNLAEIRFIPSRQPPHRTRPGATPEQRLSMLQQAISEQAGFVLDDREFQRSGPSYMVDTLDSLRAEWPQTPLCLLLGLDAFRELHTWYRWQAIPELANLLIMHRPGNHPYDLPTELKQWLTVSQTTDTVELQQHKFGRVLFHPVTQLAISATSIRARIAQGLSPRYLLPEAVHHYIDEQNLYQTN